MDDLMKNRIEQLVDYIMKNCLWQFHSRAWDRKRQNENILGMASQLLCEETIDLGTPEARCYWVDAVCLVDAYKKRYSWINALDKPQIKALIQGLHERMDYLTITGSKNAELTDQHY